MSINIAPMTEIDLINPTTGRIVKQELRDFRAAILTAFTEASNDDDALSTLITGLQTQVTNFALPPLEAFTASAVTGQNLAVNLANSRTFPQVLLDANLTVTLTSPNQTSGYREIAMSFRNTSGVAYTVTFDQPTIPIRMAGHTTGDIVYSIAPREAVQFYVSHAFGDGYMVLFASEGVSTNGSTTGGESGLGVVGGGGGGGGSTAKTTVFQVSSPSDDNYFYNQTSFVANLNDTQHYIDTNATEDLKSFMLFTKISGDDLPLSGITVTSVSLNAEIEFASGTQARSCRVRAYKVGNPTTPATMAAHDSRTYTSAAFTFNHPSDKDWSSAATPAIFPINFGASGISMIGEILSVATSPVSKILLATDLNSGQADAKFKSRDAVGTPPTLTVNWNG